MAQKKRTRSRQTQPQANDKTITSAQLAKAVGVTTKTLQRWYSDEYRLIPKPQIIRLPGSRGTRAVWPSWVVLRGVRIRQLQEPGLTLADVRSALQAEEQQEVQGEVNESVARFVLSAGAMTDRVLASDDLRELVRVYLVEQFGALVAMQGGVADQLAMACATDKSFIRHLFVYVLFGLSPVCYVDVASGTVSLKTDIHAAWYVGNGAAKASAVLSFSLASVALSLAEALNDDVVLAAVRHGARYKPAPLIWFYMHDGGIAEYALVGKWRDSSVSYQAPALRLVSPADAGLFEMPSVPESTITKRT